MPRETDGVDAESTVVGIATFLFTDVEGSTRRWESDADGMRVALAAHDHVLRAAVEAHGGAVFKHTGDGVCAVFGSPRAAVDAGVAAQRELELPVRMGIGTGDAERRDGDYFGAVLNRAARVMAAGHGGQILVDGATAGLLDSVDLIDLGPRRLRDIANNVSLFQVHAPGLRSEFPPLRTADPTAGNLHPPNTSIIGRDPELIELATVLKAHRLTTLIGVGGVGKTRLALEIATRAANSFPDGVWVIELASVADPVAVPDAVAAVLGITHQPGLSVTDSVAGALAGRSALLVFDNCEHVLDAVAEVIGAILTQSSTVTIVATSREGLRLGAEQLWPVSSLDVDSDAVALFVERGHAVAPDVDFGQDRAAVAEICRRLDGIPLAIELAASRMQSMTVAEVRDRLDDRFRLLVGSRRGLERHQTLRHAVQWSYDLLDDDEKSLLAMCSVFAGGFDLAGASAVSGSPDELATLDQLDALVRKSLLVAQRPSGRTRYSMLETIRQFAEDQLVAAGGAGAARTAHSRYFAGREADILALWDSARQREAYTWFTVELANLRTAFRWAADTDDLDTAAAVAFCAEFLAVKLEQHEPIGWAEELIGTARAVAHRRLAQLYVIAGDCYASGRLDDALNYNELARLAIESGNFDQVPFDLETSIGGGAAVMRGTGEYWITLCHKVIDGSPGEHVFARASLVMALTFAGTGGEAIRASEGLLESAMATDNPQLQSYAMAAYGLARRDSDPIDAFDVQRRGLAIAQESGNRQVEHILAVSLARLAAVHRDDPVQALDFLTLAIRVRYDSGSFSLLPAPLSILATFLDRLGLSEPAATVSGYAATPMTRRYYAEFTHATTHLREILGDEIYDELAHAGAAMTPAAITAYAFDQIDHVRAQLG